MSFLRGGAPRPWQREAGGSVGLLRAKEGISLPWWHNSKETTYNVPSLRQEDPLEKGMATHSSILAWEIPRTEEPGGL